MLLCGIKRKVLNNLVDYQGLLCDPAGAVSTNQNFSKLKVVYGKVPHTVHTFSGLIICLLSFNVG